VQNLGTIDAALLGIQACLFNCELNPHGLPGEGLLFSQITYAVTINGGQPGKYVTRVFVRRQRSASRSA
jgi:hypothetical protein